MRLRTSVAATVGALALVITLPASAGAAQGDFTYQHYNRAGIAQTSGLMNPQSRECITLPEVENARTAPAHSPATTPTPRRRSSRVSTVKARTSPSGPTGATPPSA